MPVDVQVVRVLVDAGHGLSNHTNGVYDEGASSPFGTEATIVSRVADQVEDYFYSSHDETCGPTVPISVIQTPICDDGCVKRHPHKSHLAYKVEWINSNAIHTKTAGYGDVVLSLHMNESPNPESSGALVVIDNAAPVERMHEGQQIARIVSGVLGIPNRGVMLDSETPRKSIAIVENTRPPAYLIELGFVTSSRDVQAVETCGTEAIIAVIRELAGAK